MATLLIASLTPLAAGCRAGAAHLSTKPANSGQTPVWVVNAYAGEFNEAGDFVVCKEATNGRPSLLTKTSPSGRYQIHPTFWDDGAKTYSYLSPTPPPPGPGGTGHVPGFCLVDRNSREHQILFKLDSAVTPSEWNGWRGYGLPQYPDAFFWAGDESGVYLWYADHGRLFFVTVPDGSVSRVPILDKYRRLGKTVKVLGSPVT